LLLTRHSVLSVLTIRPPPTPPLFPYTTLFRSPLSFLRALRNPTVEDVREFIRTGERTTWPKVDMIRNTTCISRTFRDCLARLDRIETEQLRHLRLVQNDRKK